MRTAGVTRPRRAAASSSRAVRESTENDVAAVADAPLLPQGGTASARLALAWSSHRLLLWNAGARWPRQHAARSRGRGEERPEQRAWCFERRADLRISEDRRSGPRQASHKDPEPPVGGLVTTARGKSSSDGRFSSRVPHLHQRVRESIIPGPLPARPGTARVGEALSVAGCPDRCPGGRAPDPARDSMPGASGSQFINGRTAACRRGQHGGRRRQLRSGGGADAGPGRQLGERVSFAQARNARGGPDLVTAYFLRWCIRRDGRHSVHVGEYGGRLARLGSQ